MNHAMAVGVFEALGHIDGPSNEGGYGEAATIETEAGLQGAASEELEREKGRGILGRRCY